MNRENLERLADYLESLPPDYKHFDMSVYADHVGGCGVVNTDALIFENPQEFYSNCGTVACAAGHGPGAGMPILPRETVGQVHWARYIERVFGFSTRSEEWIFLFSNQWARRDNTHYGAAARIRYLLDGGEPYNPNGVLLDPTKPYDRYRKSVEPSQ